MPSSKKPRARPRSLAKKPLNPRQREFIRLFCDPQSRAFGNATLAAKGAHYSGKAGSPAVQGHRLVGNPNVWEAITLALEEAGGTLQDLAQTLLRALHATEVRPVRNSKGKRVLREVPLYKTQMAAVDRILRILDAHSRWTANGPSRHQVPLPPELQPLSSEIRRQESPVAPQRNEFAESTAQERMLTRDAISAAEAWVEIEKKTRAAQMEGTSDGSNDTASEAQDIGPVKEDLNE